jgi:hypothetical protein
MNEPVWVDEVPDARNRRTHDWPALAQELRDNPGAWRLLFTQDRASLVTVLRSGSIAAMRPSDGFEFRTANNTNRDGPGPRMCDLYARWTGHTQQAPRQEFYCTQSGHTRRSPGGPFRSRNGLAQHLRVAHHIEASEAAAIAAETNPSRRRKAR